MSAGLRPGDLNPVFPCSTGCLVFCFSYTSSHNANRSLPCDRLDITLDAVNQELARLAFVDAGQFMTINSNGNACVDLKKTPTDPDPERVADCKQSGEPA
jgi:hypothetical protein